MPMHSINGDVFPNMANDLFKSNLARRDQRYCHFVFVIVVTVAFAIETLRGNGVAFAGGIHNDRFVLLPSHHPMPERASLL